MNTSTKIKNILKYLWVGLILAWAVYYLRSRSHQIIEVLELLPLSLLIQALSLIIVAKIGLVVNMKLATIKFSIASSWSESYRVYNITQLAKYIPGSIWQFVGRVAILKNKGVEGKTIRDSLIAEHLWSLGFATIFSLALILSSKPLFYNEVILLLGLTDFQITSIICIGLLALCFLVIQNKNWSRKMLPLPQTLLVQLIIWISLGLSFAITLLPYESSLSTVFIIGVYALAYTAGFVVPFAPAGLGIREAILVLALSPSLGTETAIVLAGVNRVLYLLAELLMVVPLAGTLLKSRKSA